MAEYITGSEFEVRFGMTKASFSKVSNIESKIEYESIIEGGSNDAPIFVPKPKTKPDMLILERGIDSGLNIISSFLGKKKEGDAVDNVMIFVKHNGKTKRILYFDHGILVSKSLTALDGMGKGVMIEKLQIAHTGLKEMSTSFF